MLLFDFHAASVCFALFWYEVPHFIFLFMKELVCFSCWFFVEKTSVKQDLKRKVCSNFQTSFLHLSQMDTTPPAVSSVQEWYHVGSS